MAELGAELFALNVKYSDFPLSIREKWANPIVVTHTGNPTTINED